MANWLPVILLILFVELTYVFLISAGYWTKWPTATSYYDLLAQSFMTGEVALSIEPSQAIIESENPYDPVIRGDASYLFDASYYQGEYYLYWGPAPAVLLALFKAITGATVGDNHLAFIGVNAIFIFSSLIVLRLRSKYLPTIPTWLLLTFLLIVGTSHPMLWMLNWPWIYSTAIIIGQAFLLAGLYLALPVIEGGNRDPIRLACVGTLWAFALASRLTLIGPLFILSVAVGLRLLFFRPGPHRWRKLFGRITIMAIPILVEVILLGMYNYIRFGSIFETGFQYALNTRFLQSIAQDGAIFNLSYMFPNLVHYVTAPLRFRSSFLFIRPFDEAMHSVSSVLAGIEIPS